MNVMKIYQAKARKIPGTDFKEVYRVAYKIYQQLSKKTKRRAYIRSVYFDKEKIFLESFWNHLFDKENFRDKIRRMKFFPAAIELLQHSNIDPVSIDNPNKKGQILHRFTGVTRDGDLFVVQVKEEKRGGEKWFMSVFPKK